MATRVRGPHLQDGEKAFDGLPFDLRLTGDVGDVDRLAVREAHDLQKPREHADVPNQSFLLHLLAKVEGGIGNALG